MNFDSQYLKLLGGHIPESMTGWILEVLVVEKNVNQILGTDVLTLGPFGTTPRSCNTRWAHWGIP
jgi:hypothetical protein